MEKKYQSTVYACLVGLMVQAIVNNFVLQLILLGLKKSTSHRRGGYQPPAR